MDYGDYVNNSDDEHSRDDEHSHDQGNVDDDDDKTIELVIAGCHVAVKYYIQYIEKQSYRISEETNRYR
jgi:hypothetical protein